MITFKTQEMCDKAVRRKPWLLEYVPDWFVTQEQLKLWHDDDDCDDDELIEWYEGYQKTEGPESTKKEELLPTAWHPPRRWNWCVPEDEKKQMEKLWRWTI